MKSQTHSGRLTKLGTPVRQCPHCDQPISQQTWHKTAPQEYWEGGVVPEKAGLLYAFACGWKAFWPAVCPTCKEGMTLETRTQLIGTIGDATTKRVTHVSKEFFCHECRHSIDPANPFLSQ